MPQPKRAAARDEVADVVNRILTYGLGAVILGAAGFILAHSVLGLI